MLKCRKGDTACLLDCPCFGDLHETTVVSSGRMYIKVQYAPFYRFSADTLYNLDGGGKLFIGSKQQYLSAKIHAQERATIVERIKCKLTELSTRQLHDIEYQLNQMLS